MTAATDHKHACADCGKPKPRPTKTGRCVKCAAVQPAVKAAKANVCHDERARRAAAAKAMSADADVVARRTAAMKETFAKAETRQRHADACRAAWRRRLAVPHLAEAAREAGRRFAASHGHASKLPDAMARAAATLRKRRLEWCPEEYWALNAKLKRDHVPLAERKRIILEMVPGTIEHARLQIANQEIAARLKCERDRAQAY